MDQHFLSRFYLSGFTDPEVPEGQTPFVWTQTPQQPLWKRKSPKNLASTPDLYAFTKPDGSKDQSLEELLGKVETVVAPVIKRISTGSRALSDDERQNVALFVALTQLRVPAMHDNIGDFMGRVGQGLFDILHHQFTKDPKAFKHFKERYKRDTGQNIDDLKVESLDPAKYKIKASHPSVVATSLSPVTMVSSILLQMGWKFIVTHSPYWFITCDNPFFMIDPTNKERIFGDGLGAPKIEISFPLSKEVALFASWQNKLSIEWCEASPYIVEQINLRCASFATRFLVAPKPAFPGSDKLKPRVPPTEKV